MKTTKEDQYAVKTSDKVTLWVSGFDEHGPTWSANEDDRFLTDAASATIIADSIGAVAVKI